MRLRRFLRLAIAVAAISTGRGHDAFADHIWHRVEVSAGARQIDVTVKLTFFEEWSERERRRMDADQDGSISRSELENYSVSLADDLKSRVTLSIAGQRVALIPLYAPEVDLQGRVKVERVHHQLTLHFFAALPPQLSDGAVIVIEDGLWPDAKSFGEVEATNAVGGGLLKVADVTDRGRAADGSDQPLRFTVNYVKPPPAAPTAIPLPEASRPASP